MGNYTQAIPEERWEAFIGELFKHGLKYVILAKFGTETGLRVSDILKLKIDHIRPFSTVWEHKTKKTKECRISEKLLRAIEEYKITDGLTEGDFFIYSRKSAKNKPLSRIQAYRVFKMAANALNLANIGTHSMRKTYARELYRTTGNLADVQKALNHERVETTMRYFVNLAKQVFNIF